MPVPGGFTLLGRGGFLIAGGFGGDQPFLSPGPGLSGGPATTARALVVTSLQ